MTKKHPNKKYSLDSFNAVSDFDYSTQNDEYNKEFINWRKNKNNLYAYNYSENRKEKIFVEGRGFVESSVRKEESIAIYKVLKVMGAALLISIFIEVLFDKAVVILLDLAGVDIHMSFTSSFIYGAKLPVVLVMMITDVMKIAVPLWYASKKFNMPKIVSCPKKINRPIEIVTSSALVMMVAATLSLLDVYSEESREIYTFLLSFKPETSLWHQKEFVIYIIFDVLVVTVITEMLYRGLFLAVLRQFGDVFAVIITSLLCGLMTHKYGLMPGIMIVSAVSSIGVLRSGSIFTAIYSKILYELFFLAIPFIIGKFSDDAGIYFSTGCFVLGLFLFLLAYAVDGKFKIKTFARCGTQLPIANKLALVLKCYPMIAVIISSIILGFVE